MRARRPVDQADRERLEQLRPRRRLDRLEPHGARDGSRTRSTTSRSTPTSGTATTTSSSSSAASADIDHRIEVVEGLIQAAQSRPARPAPDLHRLRRVERLVPRARRRRARTAQRLEEIYNFEDALAMGMFFNSFIRHADVRQDGQPRPARQRDRADLHEQEGPVPAAHLLPDRRVREAEGQHGRSTSASSRRPTRRTTGAPLGYLDVSATHDAKSGTVCLNVLNRSETRDIATRIENAAGASARAGRASGS